MLHRRALAKDGKQEHERQRKTRKRKSDLDPRHVISTPKPAEWERVVRWQR